MCSLKGVLKNFAIHRKTPVLETLLKQSYRPQSCNFIKRENPAYIFSCEFCEVIKTFFVQQLRVTSSNLY